MASAQKESMKFTAACCEDEGFWYCEGDYAGKEAIMLAVDRLKKFAHLVPLAHPYSVQTVAQAFVEIIIKLHGPPLSIVSDQDRILTSKMWIYIYLLL